MAGRYDSAQRLAEYDFQRGDVWVVHSRWLDGASGSYPRRYAIGVHNKSFA